MFGLLDELEFELLAGETEEESGVFLPAATAVFGGRPAQTSRRKPPPRKYPWRRRPRPLVVSRPISHPVGLEEVRWVQSTLNMVMNLRLPIDGIMGRKTRSALRDFRRREGLAADGFLGSDTKKALVDARRKLSAPPVNATTISSAKGTMYNAAIGEPAGEPAQGGEEQFLGRIFRGVTGAYTGQTNRRSNQYLRWVQAGLNKIMGLRLAVDGISGPKTRSAIRAFQQRQGLAADGIVGPNTERALIAAGAGRPPHAGPIPGTTPVGNGSALGNKIVQLANQEHQRWQQGRVKESDPRMRPVLENYWRKGAGWLPDDPAWWANYPWSAAFISWVMRQAGAGSDFKYSAAHAVYTKAAKDNRLAGNQNPFKAYRISEAASQPGDLVCKSRAGSGATYDNIREGMQTHCDIVTEVQPGRLLTIGGNVSDSVKITPVSIDGNGRISAPGYFAVIKVGASRP